MELNITLCWTNKTTRESCSSQLQGMAQGKQLEVNAFLIDENGVQCWDRLRQP